jgi:hypothetical protein
VSLKGMVWDPQEGYLILLMRGAQVWVKYRIEIRHVEAKAC